MAKIITAIDGYKTYIVAVLGIAYTLYAAHASGTSLTQDDINRILEWLGLGAVRSALAKP